jgi:hypothetical protein
VIEASARARGLGWGDKYEYSPSSLILLDLDALLVFSLSIAAPLSLLVRPNPTIDCHGSSEKESR